MWRVFEGTKARSALRRLPKEILKKYEKWKDIVTLSGPKGLRQFTGLKDEALKGKWFGFRSSRLNLQYRVMYRVVRDQLIVEVIDLNAHDYRR